ncbi:UDP-N-acetylmuramate dehydrogenase [Marmoricola sp. URHA0025 HA25]
MAELLGHHTTLRVGGPVADFVVASTEAELVAAVRDADDRGQPVLVLGGGSNLLVSDSGFDGRVVAVRTAGVHSDSDACGGAVVRVAAGEVWDDLVARAGEQGWVGVEALSGIPGLAGATPIQNVGAYGQEVSQTIASVRCWDRPSGEVRTLFHRDCRFGYRTSRLKQEPDRWVVLEVVLQLRLGDLSAPIGYAELAGRLGVAVGERAPLADVREAVLALRRGKGMVLDGSDHDTWSAGSFFTNPVLAPGDVPTGAPAWPQPDGRVKTSAAWLIEHAGFARGHGNARAALSAKHTLALTNRGAATAADLVTLAREVRDGVQQRFGVELVPEPVLVGCAL